jgi:hypothetical protein
MSIVRLPIGQLAASMSGQATRPTSRLVPIHQIRANHFTNFANATELATEVKCKCIARKKRGAMTKGKRTCVASTLRKEAQ